MKNLDLSLLLLLFLSTGCTFSTPTQLELPHRVSKTSLDYSIQWQSTDSQNLSLLQTNQCLPVSENLCAIDLKWVSSGAALLVNMDTEPGTKKLMGCDSSNTSRIGWIQKNITYTFYMVENAPCSTAAFNMPVTAQLSVKWSDSVVVNPPVNPPVPPSGSLGGVNIAFLISQYLGMASNSDGSVTYNKLLKDMAKKSLRDAKYAGAKLLRIQSSGWGPIFYDRVDNSVIGIWKNQPHVYWAAMDEMINDIQAQDLKIVMSLIWSPEAFPSLAQESIKDLITNPNSRSYQLQMQFVSEVVNRYKNHPSIIMWEMHNEFNLGVDLDNKTRCAEAWKEYIHNSNDLRVFCGSSGNYSTDEMVAYGNRFASFVKSLDPAHKVTSGHSISRPNAEHMRRSPEFSGPVDWTPDSFNEFRKNLVDIHTGFDVVSVHIYNGSDTINSRRPYLPTSDVTSAEFLRYVKQASDSVRKELFVGEYFDADTPAAQFAQTPFAQNMLQLMDQLNIPYHALWVWEFYQFDTFTHQSSGTIDFTIEPGFTDSLIQVLRNMNIKNGHGVYMPPAIDNVQPEGLISWPINGMSSTDYRLNNTNRFINVLASDNTLTPVRVQFISNGVYVGESSRAPYRMNLSQLPLNIGNNTLTAKIWDGSGNVTISSIDFYSTLAQGGTPGPTPTPTPTPAPVQKITWSSTHSDLSLTSNNCIDIGNNLCKVTMNIVTREKPVAVFVSGSDDSTKRLMTCSTSASFDIPWVSLGRILYFDMMEIEECSPATASLPVKARLTLQRNY